jgi:DNA invertase Pin-like site-specific DNA recombinase
MAKQLAKAERKSEVTRRIGNGKESMPAVVISYLRYSSLAQAVGTSIARQLQLSQEWALANGMVIDESLRDEGVSAFRGANAATGALASILQRIDRKEIRKGSVLIVENLDRLSRNEESVALELFLSIINRGVDIVTVIDGRRYAKGCKMEELIYAICVLARGRDESATKSARANHAWNAKRAAVRNGEVVGKNLPAWIKLNDKGKLEVIPAKANVVRYIFDLALKGLGITSICRKLNSEGIPNLTGKSRGRIGGGLWHTATIHQLMNRGAVIGIKELCKRDGRKRVPLERVPNYFPPIIGEDVYNQVQAMISTRRNRSYGGPSAKFVNIFNGLLRDEDNHAFMSFRRAARNNPKTGKPRMREQRYLISVGAYVKKVKATIYVRQDCFEQAFFEVMLNAFFKMFQGGNDTATSLRRTALSKQAEADAVEKQLAQLEGQLTQLKNPAPIIRAMGTLQEQLTTLQAELKQLQTDGTLTDHDKLWASLQRIGEILTDDAGNEERQEMAGLIRQLVKSIRMTPRYTDDGTEADVVIEARNGDTLPYTFRYPQGNAHVPVAAVLASLEVDIDGKRIGVAATEAEARSGMIGGVPAYKPRLRAS